MRPTTYKLAVTVEAKRGEYGIGNEYTVTAELSGFVGKGKSSQLSLAFGEAYEDLMAKVAEGVSER